MAQMDCHVWRSHVLFVNWQLNIGKLNMSLTPKQFICRWAYHNWCSEPCASLEAAYAEAEEEQSDGDFDDLQFFEVVEISVRLEKRIIEIPKLIVQKTPK